MNENTEPIKIIDVIGLYCPIPLYNTREGLDSLEVGQILEVLSDDPTSEESLLRFAKRGGHEMMLFERNEDGMRFLIRKGNGVRKSRNIFNGR